MLIFPPKSSCEPNILYSGQVFYKFQLRKTFCKVDQNISKYLGLNVFKEFLGATAPLGTAKVAMKVIQKFHIKQGFTRFPKKLVTCKGHARDI